MDEFKTTFKVEGIRDAKVSRERLGELLLTRPKDFEILSSYQPSGGDWVLLVRCAPDDIEEFSETMKAYEYRYRGPTFFNRGRIARVYATPEDERLDRPCEAYLRRSQ